MNRRYQMDIIDATDDNNFSNDRRSIHSVSAIHAFILFAGLLGLCGIVYVIDNILPTPLTIADEKNYPDSFITERAEHDLKILTKHGPRVVGSYENEVLAAQFIEQEIISIQQQAHQNQKIELDVQIVSGSYYIDYKPFGAINAYGNVQNIVAKVNSRNNSEYSLLINSHFDSVPTSPGGSDDGINCAVMLEVLRKLSRIPERPEHNIIFLFNGAEETPLQAAHGFITKHKWAKEVTVVINLEAAGSGGKEILFQSGPGQSWLLNYYSKVPHPNGQACGEELFQSGRIPSDTDFRIFRDFGGTIGYDLAFIKDGYRYHTNYDGFKNIPSGSYQHVGDNVLSLVRNLANAPELASPKQEQEASVIYYDFYGLFMITYTHKTAIILNSLTVLVSIVLAVKSIMNIGYSKCTFKYIAFSLVAVLLGWTVSGIFVFVTAKILDGFNYTMSWYRNPWIIFGLYTTPVVGCCCGILALFNNYNKQTNIAINVQTQIQAHVVRLIWTILLFIGTCLGIRSVYAILIPVLINCVIFIIIEIGRLQYSIRKWQIIYTIGTIICTIILLQPFFKVFILFVPMCGRIGSDKNPELIIGFLTLFLTICITSFHVPLITLVRKPLIFVIGLFVIFFIFFVIVFTPLGFQYSGNVDSPAPQRFWIYHNSRIFHDENGNIEKKDAGFFLLNMDRNSPNSVKNYVKDLKKAKSVEEDCKMYLYCGFPLASPRMLTVMDESTWIPAEQPIIPEPTNLKLISKVNILPNVTRYNFFASGPSHMSIYLSPKNNTKLIKTSLIPTIPNNVAIWNGRKSYYILYQWGKEVTPLNFFIDIETPENWEKPAVDIAITGKYVHDKLNVKTPHYRQFLNEFPEWANLVAWLGTYESWSY